MGMMRRPKSDSRLLGKFVLIVVDNNLLLSDNNNEETNKSS